MNNNTSEKRKQLEALADQAEPIEVERPEPKVWPEIESLDERNLPAFPTDALPNVLRKWVEAVSLATQTPASLAGLLALAVCSAMLARRVWVELPGWREPVNLFVAILLGPGNRKSAVFESAVKPMRELESELTEAARPEVARAQSERRQDETQLAKLERLASNEKERREAGTLAAELAETPVPALPRLIVDNATSEKLEMILAEQGGRIASMAPEGGVFDLMAGMYSKNGIAQLDVYLKGHAGDDMVNDRVSRGSTVVKSPAVTCAYAIQPSVIKGLAQNPAFRGRGLLARFLFAFPRSTVGNRQISPPPVPDKVRDEYHEIVRGLGDGDGEQILTLNENALATFDRWQHEIEAMLAEGGRMEIMRDWGAKLAGATLRLAAVLHAVKHSSAGQIDAATIEAAIKIGRYLIPHTESVFGMMEAKEDQRDEDCLYVLRWVKKECLQSFTRRDAHQHGKQKFKKVTDLDPALEELIRRGYIRLRPSGSVGPGRPPSPVFEVNPKFFANEDSRKRSQYPQNSITVPEAGNSEDIEDTFTHSENVKREQVTI